MWRARKRKYGEIKTKLDNIVFASKAEAARYAQLKLLERAGQISGLSVQPKFEIVVEGVRVTTYIADFSYTENGKEVVEDVKSKATRTRLYMLKKKLLKATWGIEVREIMSRSP